METVAPDADAGGPARAGQTGRVVTASLSIFVTGGTGFIGRRFLAALRDEGFERVTCLSRRSPPVESAPGWKFIPGDLSAPESWASHLAQADVVVHLAAATGSATPDELRRVNVDATRRLLHECERHGVSRMLYVSSIAAKYADLDGYPYGRTKADAELTVKGSRIDYTILRPTIVLGPESPILQRLRSLALLPVPAVLGNGKTRVQPVGADDVARAMVLILERSRFAGEILELGGPEVLTFEELIRRIRVRHRGSSPPVLHLPVTPLRAVLSGLSRLLGSRTPVSPGQLAPFVNDGVADPSDLATELRPRMTPLDDLL